MVVVDCLPLPCLFTYAPAGGELQSQAYYIVKAAQERQELQGEAEELERRIAQTERECRALQVHLGSLVGTNADMNQHFRLGAGRGYGLA